METRIVTRHPDPNQEGANISKDQYDTLKQAIMGILDETGELDEKDLPVKVHEKLDDTFTGDLDWYTQTVKLDLLARDHIEHVPGKPTHIREKTFY